MYGLLSGLNIAQNLCQILDGVVFCTGVNQIHIPRAVVDDAVAVAERFCAVKYIKFFLHQCVPLAENGQFLGFARLKMTMKWCRRAAVSRIVKHRESRQIFRHLHHLRLFANYFLRHVVFVNDGQVLAENRVGVDEDVVLLVVLQCYLSGETVRLAEKTIVGGNFFLGVGGGRTDAARIVLQHVMERAKINGARPYALQARKHFCIMFARRKLPLQQVVNVVFHNHQFLFNKR